MEDLLIYRKLKEKEAELESDLKRIKEAHAKELAPINDALKNVQSEIETLRASIASKLPQEDGASEYYPGVGKISLRKRVDYLFAQEPFISWALSNNFNSCVRMEIAKTQAKKAVEAWAALYGVLPDGVSTKQELVLYVELEK